MLLQVPYRLLKNFHKIQQRLVRELEKKFSGKDVVIVANRRIMPPPTSGKSNARPRSRTLTAVSAAVACYIAWAVDAVGQEGGNWDDSCYEGVRACIEGIGVSC